MENSSLEQFAFRLLRQSDVQELWHSELEIVFLLQGTGRVFFSDLETAYTLKQADVFVVNCFEVRGLELDPGGVALSFLLSQEFVGRIAPELLKRRINCRSFLYEENNQGVFHGLRQKLAVAFRESYKTGDSVTHGKSSAAAVLEYISRFFASETQRMELGEGQKTMQAITGFIQEHYREKITLEDLANQTYLSKPYLSRMFSKRLGISFTGYLELLRLNHARQLLAGGDTLGKIAEKSGFPSANALILSTGAKPMLELSFMPGVLARDGQLTSMRGWTIAAPRDVSQWKKLIHTLMEHLKSRYGGNAMEKWLFSPWLQPDFADMGVCTRDEYAEVYAGSYHAIREALPRAMIVGPGCATDCWDWFLAFCREKDCMPDILSFRSFATAGEQEDSETSLVGSNESFPFAVSGDENILAHSIKALREKLKQEGLNEKPLILEEWSSTIWQRDLCNDTCYKSAYIFKNVLENNNQIGALGYFALNDRLEEIPPLVRDLPRRIRPVHPGWDPKKRVLRHGSAVQAGRQTPGPGRWVSGFPVGKGDSGFPVSSQALRPALSLPPHGEYAENPAGSGVCGSEANRLLHPASGPCPALLHHVPVRHHPRRRQQLRSVGADGGAQSPASGGTGTVDPSEHSGIHPGIPDGCRRDAVPENKPRAPGCLCNLYKIRG